LALIRVRDQLPNRIDFFWFHAARAAAGLATIARLTCPHRISASEAAIVSTRLRRAVIAAIAVLTGFGAVDAAVAENRMALGGMSAAVRRPDRRRRYRRADRHAHDLAA
jgi:hypothetical protein